MFFIGIFGIESRDKFIKVLNNFVCKNCRNLTTARLIKEYDFFHFFFIPLFKWNIRYYIVCDSCKAIFEISKEKGTEIEHGEDISLQDSDLKIVKANNYNPYEDNSGTVYNNPYASYDNSVNNDAADKSEQTDRICPICKKNVKAEYKYCPYCGQRVR